MTILSFSFNNDTYNTKIDLLEHIDLSKVKLNIECLKSFDDEDYYEVDLDKNEYEISKLNFKSTDNNTYEVTFDAKITLSEDKWQNVDEKFKKNALDGLIEVEFNLEQDGKLFEYEEGFLKDCDGQTELFLD
jgi:hypothetical protein|tara:strand:- start:67 stop:462 length:396 start_codon:yes stop_codon:yes gene_type:complete